MYLQTAVTLWPAWTVMTMLDAVVGVGAPLQARELEVTSSMGPLYEGIRTPPPTPWLTPPTSSEEKMVSGQGCQRYQVQRDVMKPRGGVGGNIRALAAPASIRGAITFMVAVCVKGR
jgi:hypothetical protein